MLNINSFKTEVQIDSPGRINLIGEHIDYNGGLVLPAAIDKKISFSFKKNGSNTCEIHSVNLNSSFTIDLSEISRSESEWQNYILGVIYHIDALKAGSVKGFDCVFESNLPIGSGISSSAALECGMAKGLNELFNIGLTDLEMIKLSRDAEHTFVGTKCGIMDQFAVMKGKENKLLLLNCDTLDYKYIPADFSPYTVVLLNTNVSHSLASSEYNVRRDECNTALGAIQKKYPEYNSLAEIEPEVIEEFRPILPEKVYNRALYVSREQRRTLEAVECLEKNDLKGFGDCLYRSHEGLQHLYEVSCKELDFLVDFSKDHKYVIGSRMMGGGFGGCTINLIQSQKVDKFIEKVSDAYRKMFDLELTPIEVKISSGVSRSLHRLKK
ncbi:galactokinase [Lutimonas zeaxanthinifaciens]|uniref:galactokinase n=1 Tax=Lutimonas zeaxanthinifaciens TaxID=3060215 RepID=UPI00265CF433|nr:galactokinase [Lutimonas sp. YSD2104]WKK66479.1 galactokinase [Lutimonas sp. YSD2104]